MSLGKKLFIGGGGGDGTCFTDLVHPFGDESAYISNVALYQLDSDGGTTNNVPDTVGNYNGTASNVTYSTGKYGNAAVFNGSSSNITISGFKGYSKQTWSFWINPDVVNSRGHLMGTYPSGTIGQGAMYVELQSNGNVEAGVRNSGGSTSSVITTTPLTASQWYHIVVTSSGSELKLYINGASPITTSATVTTLDSTNVGSLAIGYEQRNNTFYFDGDIDQVRIYDKALSSAEVGVLYNETASTASDTNVLGEGSGVALYSLDYDASDGGGNYDGTATDVTFGVDGQINYGASFNGTSSSIDIGTIPELPSNTNNEVDFTFSAWVKSNTTDLNAGGGSNPIFVNQNNSYQFIGFGGNDNGNFPTGRIFYYTFGGSGQHNSWIITDETFDDDNWHHVVVTDVYNSGTNNRTRTLYVDNVQKKQDTVDKNFNANTVSTYLGSTSTAYSKQYLDQVRIFSKGLSSAEISTLYGETACVYASTTDTVGFPSSASSNLFAYYKLDNTGNDESANGHDGTQGSSMAYSFGRFGTGGSFDGSNNAVITIPDSNKFSPTVNDFSVSFWFNISSTSTQRMIAKGSNPYEWEIWVSNGQPVYVGYSPGGAGHGVLYGGSNPGIYADGNWHHIVVTHDYGTKMEMFVDNVSIGSLTTFTGYGMGNTSSTVTIGKRGDQSTSMTGRLDQIRFYDKILTTDEIAELYNEKQEAEPNFNIALYEGNGSSQYISNVGFQPDFVWIKNRVNANAGLYFDSVRGVEKYLRSDGTSGAGAEVTLSGAVSSFDSNGFTHTSIGNGSVNRDGDDYVAWCWKGGGDAVSNTVGTITSQVSANQDAGFSIVKWTGNDTANATIGHGLASSPEMYIIKKTSAAADWQVNLASSVTGTEGYANLNATAALYTTFPNYYTSANSTVLSTNGTTTAERLYNNQSADYVAYCFHSVTGYQKIGSFTYSAGVSVNVGFEPQFVMFKKTSAAGSWTIVDNKRFSGTTDYGLFANLSNAEVTNTDYLNLTSTGFTTTYSDTGTFIYLAIA